MKASEVLENGAQGLEKWGWAQHDELTHDSRMCSIGALKYGVGRYREVVATRAYFGGLGTGVTFEKEPALMECPDGRGDWQAFYKAKDYLRRVIDGFDTVEIVDWNDAESRTADEVVTALRHAAKFAKEDEDAAA